MRAIYISPPQKPASVLRAPCCSAPSLPSWRGTKSPWPPPRPSWCCWPWSSLPPQDASLTHPPSLRSSSSPTRTRRSTPFTPGATFTLSKGRAGSARTTPSPPDSHWSTPRTSRRTASTWGTQTTMEPRTSIDFAAVWGHQFPPTSPLKFCSFLWMAGNRFNCGS